MQTEQDRLSYLLRLQNIPHYYGDYVRALFVAAAALAAVVMPVFGDLLPFGVFVQVLGMLVLVFLAGLTNPHGRVVMVCNAVVAAMGALLLETAAISLYASDSFALFAAREAAALLLLFAFYFSVKTLRAMMLGKLGKMERPWEFEGKE